MSEAKETYVPDPDTACKALVNMALRADQLQQSITAILERIATQETGKPWGNAPEYGAKFNVTYETGHGGTGAAFIKDNIKLLAAEVHDGTKAAYGAIRGTVNFDEAAAEAFKVTGSENVGANLTDPASLPQK